MAFIHGRFECGESSRQRRDVSGEILSAHVLVRLWCADGRLRVPDGRSWGFDGLYSVLAPEENDDSEHCEQLNRDEDLGHGAQALCQPERLSIAKKLDKVGNRLKGVTVVCTAPLPRRKTENLTKGCGCGKPCLERASEASERTATRRAPARAQARARRRRGGLQGGGAIYPRHLPDATVRNLQATEQELRRKCPQRPHRATNGHG